jgi:serine/threonine protein phosphatase PrpC/ribosomal protein L37E
VSNLAIGGTPLESEQASETRPRAAGCARCGAAWVDVGAPSCVACGFRFGSSSSSSSPPPPPSSTTALPFDADVQVEVDESFRLAASAHPGLRRENNEDAVTFAVGTTLRGHRFRILVVCDGVSSSSRAEQASQIGARRIRDALSGYCLGAGATFDGSREAMANAILAAHAEICANGVEVEVEAEPPGTTCVAALVIGERVVVGWVGDSRAYWVTDRSVDLLTRDHSWANEAVDRGEATLAEAMRAPHAHALTRCLGPQEAGEAPLPVRPDVVARRLATKGVLLLCTDGLWNYYPLPEQMGGLVHRCGPAPSPAELARFLVHKALARGGQDNVSVVVYSHVPR